MCRFGVSLERLDVSRYTIYLRLWSLAFCCCEIGVQEFDTVLAATGRNADVAGLGLERVGVKLGSGGKVRCRSKTQRGTVVVLMVKPARDIFSV